MGIDIARRMKHRFEAEYAINPCLTCCGRHRTSECPFGKGGGRVTARSGMIGTTRHVSDDEAAKREARRVRFAGVDARSADATRKAAPATPRVPWSGGVMKVIMPQRLQAQHVAEQGDAPDYR